MHPAQLLAIQQAVPLYALDYAVIVKLFRHTISIHHLQIISHYNLLQTLPYGTPPNCSNTRSFVYENALHPLATQHTAQLPKVQKGAPSPHMWDIATSIQEGILYYYLANVCRYHMVHITVDTLRHRCSPSHYERSHISIVLEELPPCPIGAPRGSPPTCEMRGNGVV